MTFVNCTPHAISLNNGTTFSPSGIVPRVSCSFTDADADGICSQVYGDIQGLPDPVDGTVYIVSAMVLAGSSRGDLVAPATGHPDVVRNDKGHIVSVPCFVR